MDSEIRIAELISKSNKKNIRLLLRSVEDAKNCYTLQDVVCELEKGRRSVNRTKQSLGARLAHSFNRLSQHLSEEDISENSIPLAGAETEKQIGGPRLG